jgi:hypothetical protein
LFMIMFLVRTRKMTMGKGGEKGNMAFGLESGVLAWRFGEN